MTKAPLPLTVAAKMMRVVMTTTALALCVASLAMLAHELYVYRTTYASDLSTEATILAASTAPALAFDDRAVAERNLNALKARRRITVAALYGADGRLYASYVREGEAAVPLRRPPAGERASGSRIEFVLPVQRNGEMLGSIYLRAQYDVVGRLETYLTIFGLVMLLSLAVALLFSQWLQRGITRPLDSMARVARDVASRRDYSLRAAKSANDEIGVVVDAFNDMLQEVQRSQHALNAQIAEREAAESALSKATARLESTMAAAEIGSWLWDLRTHRFTADRNFLALFGIDDDRAFDGDPALHRRYVHPEDLPSLREADAQALRSGLFQSTEFRVQLAGGAEKWFARRGKVQTDAAGKPVSVSGLLIDITAQKRAESALRRSEKLYRAIGESIDYGVWVCDRQGRSLYVSESLLRLVGRTQDEVAKHGWAEALHPDDAAATGEAWKQCIASGGVWYREHRIRGTDGLYRPVLAQGVPIRGDRGEIAGWAGINLDISRLKLTEEALRETDRRKDEFLATLAHELRNPLAPIRHAVRLLESATLDARQARWAREVIARQVQRMALLLDDLLDVSRITRGRLALKVATVSLESVVGAAVETARPLIDSKQQRLTIDLPDRPLDLAVDPLRISQALSNLLTNAAKYTDAGGSIALRATVTAEAVLMCVQDTGIGFEPGMLPGMFDMFSQVDSAIDRAEGGLGIGLSLVKGLMELHGGSVEAVSAGPGSGSEFTLRLPRSVLVPTILPTTSAAAGARTNAPCRVKVLIADDNRDAADSLAMLLQMSGYEVFARHGGADALTLAAAVLPHAMILDIGMPEMTGYEVAREVRTAPWGSEVLLVAVTGWGQKDDKVRAAEAGFDHHLTKPVDPDQIEQLLHARFGAPASASEPV